MRTIACQSRVSSTPISSTPVLSVRVWAALGRFATCVTVALLSSLGSAVPSPVYANEAYVVASSANLRAEAKATAAVIERLSIAQKVYRRQTEGRWVQVTVAGRVGPSGWIARSLLSPNRPTAPAMWLRFDEARTDRARRRWAERAAALAPNDTRSLARLVLALRKLKDFDALKRVLQAIQTRYARDPVVARPETEAAIRQLWRALPASKSGCDSYDYFPRGGIKSLWCHGKTVMTLLRLRQLAGVAPYVAGPSQKRLALNAENDFSRYHPAFVRWLIDHGIPSALDPAGLDGLQPSYDRVFRTLARTYLRIVYEIETKDRGASLKEAYAEWLDEEPPRDRPFHRRFEDQQGNVGTHAMAFWARRLVDGTAWDFKRALEKMVLLYDPEGLIRIRAEIPPPPAPRGYRLAMVGDFHADEQKLEDGEEVFALRKIGDKFSTNRVKIRQTRILDEIVDGDGPPTGVRVTIVPSSADIVALIDGEAIRRGPLPVCTGLTHPPQTGRFSFGGTEYTLEVIKTRPTEAQVAADGTHYTVVLSKTKTAQTGEPSPAIDAPGAKMMAPARSAPLTSQAMPKFIKVLFAGDLDGDGALDLLLDTKSHYNHRYSWQLWLSSIAPPGALMGLAAKYVAVGC